MVFDDDERHPSRPPKTPPARIYLPEKAYRRWLVTTYYGYAALVVVIVLLWRISISVDQEQLTAFAAAAGVFAALALTISPLIGRGAPEELTPRAFLLLALTFTFSVVLILLSKLSFGQSASFEFYGLALGAAAVVAVGVPLLGGTQMPQNLRHREIYVEVILLVVPVYPFNLIAAGIVSFLFGSLQLIAFMIVAFGSIADRAEWRGEALTETKVKVAVQRMLIAGKAAAMKQDDILRELTGEGLVISPDALADILEEMNHELDPNMPSLARGREGDYFPRWTVGFEDALLASLPDVLGSFNREATRPDVYLSPLAAASGISNQLIGTFEKVSQLVATKYEELSDRGRVLVVRRDRLAELQSRLRRMPIPALRDAAELTKWIRSFEASIEDLGRLTKEEAVADEVVRREQETVNRLGAASKDFFTMELTKNGHLEKSAPKSITAENIFIGKGRLRDEMRTMVASLKYELDPGGSPMGLGLLTTIAESAGDSVVSDIYNRALKKGES